MHRRIIILLSFLLLVCASGLTAPRPVHAGPDVFISFRADLAPYGHWFQYGSYGWVWRPTHVHRGWRPYRDGHWIYTDVGWTWVADEPWGWAPYHYGRWFYEPAYGWAWVPGDEWAPAWVTWRHGDGFVGWAPLPPWARWSSGGGLDVEVYVQPAAYSFVEERYLVAPHIGSYIVPAERNVTIINQTRNVTNYQLANNRIVNRSLDVGEVERVVGHRITPRPIAAVHAAAPRPLRAARREEQRERTVEQQRTREDRAGARHARPERRAMRKQDAAPERHTGPARHEELLLLCGFGFFT